MATAVRVMAVAHHTATPTAQVLGTRVNVWMARARPDLDAVLLGVGAAFDFHAGVKTRAPAWMQRAGLEWLHRLAHEPRRLAGRYLVTNSLFLAASARAALARRMR